MFSTILERGDYRVGNRTSKIRSPFHHILRYVKFKGLNPRFHVFFCFFFILHFLTHFCLPKTKIHHLQFLAVVLCKTVSVLLFDQKIGYCYWRRTNLHKKPDENGSPTRRSRASLYMTSLFPHFAVPFENSTRKLYQRSFFRAGEYWRRAIKTNLSVQSAKQIKDRSVQIIWFSAAEPDIPCSEARRHGSTAAVSSR